MKGTDKPTQKTSYLRYNISMGEVIVNSLEDTLIDGLSFKLAKTASYMTSKRSCTYHPQGSNIYTSQNDKNSLRLVSMAQTG